MEVQGKVNTDIFNPKTGEDEIFQESAAQKIKSSNRKAKLQAFLGKFQFRPDSKKLDLMSVNTRTVFC